MQWSVLLNRGAEVTYPLLPGPFSHYVSTVRYATTQLLEPHLQKGWRIIALCVKFLRQVRLRDEGGHSTLVHLPDHFTAVRL